MRRNMQTEGVWCLQAQFGKCVQPYMMQKTAAAPQGFCAVSCQRCVKCG